MSDEYINIDDLLAKQFAGEASPDELAQINAWLKASPDNARHSAEMQWVWTAAAQAQPDDLDVDTERALRRVKQQIRPARPHWHYLGWLIAVLALAGGGVWTYRQLNPPQPEVIMASREATLTDTLTDGSQIVLNRGSGLTLDAHFNQKERRAKLTGEAYFQVSPDKTRPFVVEVAQLEVRVVGTAFNVFENGKNRTVEVSVTEGRVQLRSRIQEELIGAGEMAIFDSQSGQITRQTAPNPNVLAYQNRRFVFAATPLKSVIEQLSRAYGVDIVLKNPKLGDCLLDARFDNKQLDQVLNIIADTFNFTVSDDHGVIVLNGANCDE